MSTTIESLELEIKSNSKSAADGIDALTQSLERLGNATKNLGLSGVAKDTGKLKSALDKVSDTNDVTAKSFARLHSSLKSVANTIKQTGKTIYSFIEKSSDYVENVNLFTVAMGEYASEAKAYADTVSEAMGIDPGEWMRNQGVFQTLATGFGVAGDRAATMSKNLTQLGYDLSSFYNISVEDAMQKIKSGFAGELEPLRAVGYDLSQAKLEATAFALGIDKSVSSMTQAEKAQLRYYAIMTQVTTVQGDMARTLESPANQLRVLKAQINMAAREIGNIFIPALNAILPYAIAVTKVIRILASNIASLFGYEMPDMSESTNKVVENTDALQGNLEGAEKEAKKLKSYMLGFDELNVINPTEDSGIDDTLGGFDFALPEYDFLEGLVESKVATIVEEMKEWLGITEDIDSWAELMDTRLGTILESALAIGAALAAWKITTTTMNAIDAISKLLSNPVSAIAISVILTVTGITLSFIGMDDAIKNGLDGFNFAEIIGGALLGAGGAALLGAKIVTWIGQVCSTKVVFALAELGKNLGVTTAGALGAAIGASIAGIVLGIPAYFVGIYDACVEGIDWLSGLLIGAGATAAGAGIGAIIGMLGGPIGAGIGALIGLAVGLVTDLVILIVQNWDKISAWFVGLGEWFNTNVIQPVVGFFKGLWKSVSNFFKNLWKDIVEIWSVVTSWFDEKVITPVVEFFRGLWTSISGFFVTLWNDIVSIWNTVATWFNENIVVPVVDFFRGLWVSISGFFKSLWEDIVSVWSTVSTWFDENVITPISDFFEGVTMRIGQFFEGCWIIIQAVWYLASTWFNENVIVPIVDFFKGLWESVSSFFVSLWNDIVALWNTVSTWFNDNVIVPIVEFFRGVWESVSGFFTQLWADIVTIWTLAPTWFNETIIIPVVEFFRGLWETVSGFFSQLWEDIKKIWNVVTTWFNEKIITPVKTAFKKVCKDIGDFFSNLWDGIVEIWTTVSTWFNENIIEPVKTAFKTACEAIGKFFESLWLSIRQGVAGAMNGVIGGIESAINWVVRGINNLISGFNDVVQWAADVIGADWGGVTLLSEVKLTRVIVPEYAEGGFPEQGQMFIAREAGAEMVGSIGRRTAVANNDQIVAGIASGVAEANGEQNVLLREQNSLLRAILEKDSGVYLDGKNLTNSVEKYQRERGRVLVTGGVM